MIKKSISLFHNSILYSILVLAALSFAIVILRYFFGFGKVWIQELLIYLHSYILLFGAVKTLKLDKHVRVDVFYNNLKQVNKNRVNKLGFLTLCLPFCLTIIYTSIPYVLDSWKWLEKSSDAGGLPFVFILKTFIPVFAALLLLQGFLSQFFYKKKKTLK